MEGIYNNKNYEFRIVKNTRQSKTRNLTEERLLVRYIITDNLGAIIEDTTTLPTDSWYVIKGDYLAKTGSYVLYYQGKQYKCGQNGNIFISVYRNNSSIMGLSLSVFGEIYNEDCPNGAVEQVLLTNLIDLTKQ